MSPKDGKRRLPVLQPKSPEEEEADLRPPWHWAVIGAVAIVLALVPLLMVSQYLLRLYVERVAGPPTRGEWLLLGVLTMATQILPLAFAAFLGGLFVGRFGGRAGRKEATAAGLGVGLFAALYSLPGMARDAALGGWLFSAGVVLVLAAVLARVGAVLGLRRRRGPQ